MKHGRVANWQLAATLHRMSGERSSCRRQCSGSISDLPSHPGELIFGVPKQLPGSGSIAWIDLVDEAYWDLELSGMSLVWPNEETLNKRAEDEIQLLQEAISSQETKIRELETASAESEPRDDSEEESNDHDTDDQSDSAPAHPTRRQRLLKAREELADLKQRVELAQIAQETAVQHKANKKIDIVTTKQRAAIDTGTSFLAMPPHFMKKMTKYLRASDDCSDFVGLPDLVLTFSRGYEQVVEEDGSTEAGLNSCENSSLAGQPSDAFSAITQRRLGRSTNANTAPAKTVDLRLHPEDYMLEVNKNRRRMACAPALMGIPQNSGLQRSSSAIQSCAAFTPCSIETHSASDSAEWT